MRLPCLRRLALGLLLLLGGIIVGPQESFAGEVPQAGMLLPQHNLLATETEDSSALRNFPPPDMLAAATRSRNGGIALVIYGAAATVAGFSLTIAGVRNLPAGDPGEAFGGGVGSLPAPLILGSVFQLTGALSLVNGLPLMSHGSQMRGQLLRNVRGDEKLPRAVAVQKAYWRAHRRWHFGQALAMSGGLSTIPALLVTVGTIFALTGATEEQPVPMRIGLLIPAVWGASIATLISGLRMLKRGRTEMDGIRDAHRRERERLLSLRVTPVIDPFQRAGGLQLSGTF